MTRVISELRLLPLPGEVRVGLGDKVSPDTIVAYAEVPGFTVPTNVAYKLGVESHEVPLLMVKQVGEKVEKGEVIARKSLFFGLSADVVKSLIAGTIESVSFQTGVAIVRSHPVPVSVIAHIAGEVIEVLPHEGAVVKANAHVVEGVFGLGGERHGEIAIAVNSLGEALTPAHLSPDMKGKVVVGGGLVTLEAMLKARNIGVASLVAGSVNDRDLSQFLGYDLGLFMTGQEQIGFTFIITEGFGDLCMNPDGFNLLKSCEGTVASVNGTTQVRTEGRRPRLVLGGQRSQS